MNELIFTIGFVLLVSRWSQFRPVEDMVMFFQVGDFSKCTIKGLEFMILTCLQVTVAMYILALFEIISYTFL